MFDYLFKGLVTVNNKHDNSTKIGKEPKHSYDTTFLVVVVTLLLVFGLCYVVYRQIYRSAKRRVQMDVYKSTQMAPLVCQA